MSEMESCSAFQAGCCSSPSSSGCEKCGNGFDTSFDSDLGLNTGIQSHHDSGFKISFRCAEDGDLDAISSIGIRSFPSDPQWNYRYPYRKKFPEDHSYFAKQRYAEWLAASRTAACMIIVAVGNYPQQMRGKNNQDIVLAFSIWKLPTTQANDKVKPPVNRIRRDANHARMKAYRDSSLEAEKQFFEARFGRSRMDLAQLVTHPKFRRQGLATRMVQFGQMMATKHSWAIGVFPSPTGEKVYEQLGFEVLGIVVTKAEGDSEILKFPAMAWRPSVSPGHHIE